MSSSTFDSVRTRRHLRLHVRLHRGLHRGLRLHPLAQAIAAAGLLASPLLLQAQGVQSALPTGLQVMQGQASVATQGAQMTVRNSTGAILNWQSFSIGAANKVVFEQASAASKVLNRVTGGDPSLIYGQLSSNGQVWLLNPNGVLFGAGARIDVAGLVASTLRLNDNDFLAGRYRFTALEGDKAGVRNEGAITSSHGGQIVLLGSRVENTGSVEAPAGQVTLASARSVELVDTGLPNLSVRVDVAAGETLNLGRLAAAGGAIDVFGAIVNQQGLVQADSLGTDAAGRVVLKASETLTLGEASRTTAVATPAGSAGAAAGKTAGHVGGQVDLLGEQVALLGQAVVDVSGTAGGGGIRVGGGEQGRDSTVANARAVWFGPGAALRADASGDSGQGGRIVMWSDAATRAYGTLSAHGGRAGGNGGFIETSGGWLDARPAHVDLSSANGRAGRWLLDPNNITINNAGPDTNIGGGPDFSSTNDGSVIGTATLAAALNAGTSVSVSTAALGANTQAGDIVIDAATLNVSPSQAVTLTLNAARDIVVRNSSIASTGQALSLDLVAAGSGIGAIEIRSSNISTAGGNLTLGGAIAQQLPLPGGLFTPQSYKPAVGYVVGNGPASLTTSNGQTAIALNGSTLNLGSGRFKATGLTRVDNNDGFSFGSDTGTTVLNAARIEIVGVSSVSAPVQVDGGVLVRGSGTDMTATQSFTIDGAGRLGVALEGGARLALNAAVGSDASFTINGVGTDNYGIAVFADSFGAGAPGRGSRITVNNGALAMTGNGTQGPGIGLFKDSGTVSPVLDLAGATSASLSVQNSAALNGFPNAYNIIGVDIVTPTNGAMTVSGDLGLYINKTRFAGSGGSLSLSAQGTTITESAITSTGAALNLSFATTGSDPGGVRLSNTIVSTAGGNVRFGADQIVCSNGLGCTTTAAPWLENANGSFVNAGLVIDNSVIDAGSGRIVGGGAARDSALNVRGLDLLGSSLLASEITLKGRSDGSLGVQVQRGSYAATKTLTLDGASASGASTALTVLPGTVLQLNDAAAATGSALRLLGTNLVSGTGVAISGGPVGGTIETVLRVDGAELLIQGSAGAGGVGLQLAGNATAPGGLLIDAIGATRATLSGSVANASGVGLDLSYTNVLGPQAAVAGASLLLQGNGFDSGGGPGLLVRSSNVSSGSVLQLRGNSLRVDSSLLRGDAGIQLAADTGTGAPAAAPIVVNNSTLRASGDGARIAIEGSAGDAARGLAGYESGRGVGIYDSDLLASGAGGRIAVQGQGAASGGTGVTLRGTAFTASNVTISGRGKVDGDGVYSENAVGAMPTQINATDLTVTGFGANSTTTQTAVGVRLGNGTEINLRSGGAALLQGDTVVLGNVANADGFFVGGSAASFTVASSGSQVVQRGTLDFRSGSGTDVNLIADSDDSGFGRARIDRITLYTGGGGLTMSGKGVYGFDPQGNPQAFNNTVREGAAGAFVGASLIDAAGGSVLLQGRAAQDGRSSAAGNLNGLGFTGTTRIDGGAISLEGTGGDGGVGINLDFANVGGVLNLNASSISVLGTGRGLDPVTSVPNAGVQVQSASTWVASGAVTIDSAAGPLGLRDIGITGARVDLLSAERLGLQDATVSTSNGFTMRSSSTLGGPVSLLRSSVGASASGAELRIERIDGGAIVGIAGVANGQGVTLIESSLASAGFAGRIVIKGSGAASGGDGVVFTNTTFTATGIDIQGRGLANANGVFSDSVGNGVQSVLTATDLAISGFSADDPAAPSHAGVRLGYGVALNLAGRGNATLSGDTVVLGSGTAGAQTFVAGGDAAAFTVSSIDSLRVRNARLDFSGGAGTTVSLRADSDDAGGGRMRLERSTVLTGGGNFSAAGIGVRRSTLGVTQNSTVLEGALGVYLDSTTVDAGAGTISLNGVAPNDGNPPAGFAGNSGLGTFGSNSLRGSAITMAGDGGDLGTGINVGTAGPGTVLNLQADSITVTGKGVGVDPETLLPYAGVDFNSASTWTVGNGGALTVSSSAGPMAISGLTASAGSMALNAAGPLTLSGSTLTASGALAMTATATSTGAGLTLREGLSLTGGSVSLSGSGVGDAGVFADAASGSITATGGLLRITGREPGFSTAGVVFGGAWALSAPNEIRIDADTALVLSPQGGVGAGPSLSAGQRVAINLDYPGGASLVSGAGAAPASLNGDQLAAALAGQGPNTLTVITASEPSGFIVNGSLALNSRLQVLADRVTLLPAASLSSSAGGDAVVLAGASTPDIGNFDNQAGAGVLSTPNGRWVLRLADPRTARLGGLASAFTAFGLAGAPWQTDAQGNLVTPAAGNGIGFALTPIEAGAGGPLGGLLARDYDATRNITLDPQTWAISGLLGGDTLSLSGVTLALLDNKNAGLGKAVTLDPGSVFAVTDSAGKPVFGYTTPVFTANIAALPLVVSGTVAANKVYDGTLAATLASAGSVTPLAGDLVAVGGNFSAAFADKNVGVGKAVTVTGLALTGLDAGNYTLSGAPAGVVASISARPLPVAGLAANDKVYDTTTAATLAGTASIAALAGDAVALQGNGLAQFADKNAGAAKAVTVSGFSLAGVDAGNYLLQAPAGLTATITRAPLALSGLGAVDKVYDAGTQATLTGTAAVQPLAGDLVALTGSGSGSFASKAVGVNKAVTVTGLALSGLDAGNYTLQLPGGLTANISPAALTLSGVQVAGKVYDGGTVASAGGSLAGVIAGDNVSVALNAQFADRNVGAAKPVNYTAQTAGADAGNYTLGGGSGSSSAAITPATLVYSAAALSSIAGSPLPVLTGSVLGYVTGDTQANATTGTLAWTTPATPASLPGSYAVAGSGLAAQNYVFVQAPGNATALTLTTAARSDPATNATVTGISTALFSVQLPVTMSSPTEGRVLDVMQAMSFGGADGRLGEGDGLAFRSMNYSLMTRDEVQSVLAARASYKKKIFAASILRLEQDPTLADVRPCRSEPELETGNCIITEQLKQQIQEVAARAAAKPRKADRRKVKQAVLPKIERKLALLIGINKYSDKRVPELSGAVPDARAVRDLLETRLGYETTVLENPSRDSIVRAFNKLALEAEPGDSVVVYYAGHGVEVPVAGVDTGFWLPADSNAEEPDTWLANADIGRLVAAIGSRQLMLVSDSCYSGTLAGNERVVTEQKNDADELLKRRAAVIMSSGGNEPVADEGREGHSVFAWHFMQALQGLDGWQVGGNLFERVRAAVAKEFPQTPQYGASRTAGHQGNTDYLFERREFEPKAP